MQDAFPIDIYLCVVSSDPKFLVVKDDYSFPSVSLEKGKTPRMIAANLLLDLLGFSESWAALLSLGVSDASMKKGYADSIVLPYVCFIVETTRLSGEDKYAWVNYQTLKTKASSLTLFLAQECVFNKKI